MFGKKELSLGRVHDTIVIKEGEERLKLRVDVDPMRIMAGLSVAQQMLKTLNDESTEEEQLNAAKYFAVVIFGKEQAEQLCEFYRNDAACVISICGKYFSERLSKLIAKAQKK